MKKKNKENNSNKYIHNVQIFRTTAQAAGVLKFPIPWHCNYYLVMFILNTPVAFIVDIS